MKYHLLLYIFDIFPKHNILPIYFEHIDILSFKKLVVQRIYLLMFKRHTGITLLPMNNLFTVNNPQHDYYTRPIDSLHTQIGKKLFSFHRILLWNHMSREIPIDVSYACYKKIIYNVIRFHTESHTYLDYI